MSTFRDYNWPEERRIEATWSTYVDVLKHHAEVRGDKIALTWINEDGSDGASFTYRQLLDKSSSLAYKMLTKWKINRGDRVILMYPPGTRAKQTFAPLAFYVCACIVACLTQPQHALSSSHSSSATL